MYDSPTQRGEEIEFAATLPAQALRNLSDHAAIHLNVEWRDLPAEAWSTEVRTAQGRTVPVSETVWMRTREVWIHAVDLDNGGTFEHFPREVVDGILGDILGAWDKRRAPEKLPVFSLEYLDRETPSRFAATSAPDVALTGESWRIAEWATGRGRGTELIAAGGGEIPPAPRWL
jgi:maleylpyruvate isomerase